MAEHSFDLADAAALLGIPADEVRKILTVEQTLSGNLVVSSNEVLAYLEKQHGE